MLKRKTGKDLFESIGSLSAPAPPPPPTPAIYIDEHKSESSLQSHHKTIHNFEVHITT